MNLAHDDRGVALIATIIAMTLLTSLAAAVVLTTMTETAISANYREGTQTFYAAEAGLEYVIQELSSVSDWSDILTGDAPSAFADGPPGGTRTVGAAVLDLDRATADVNAVGRRTSPYSLYAYGSLENVVEDSSSTYVMVWVADRSEKGSDEVHLGLFAQAYGPTGSRRGVVAVIATGSRPAEDGWSPIRILSWSEMR